MREVYISRGCYMLALYSETVSLAFGARMVNDTMEWTRLYCKLLVRAGLRASY